MISNCRPTSSAFLSTRLLNMVQKCILVSTYSHSHISILCGTCTLREQKINSYHKSLILFALKHTSSTFDKNTQNSEEHQDLLIHSERITANQWVFYWTLFSFSNWFFTWASSVSENTRRYLCSRSPWRHVSSTSVINWARARAVLRAPNQLQRKHSALCWKGTWCVAETLIYHKYLLTKLAEL